MNNYKPWKNYNEKKFTSKKMNNIRDENNEAKAFLKHFNEHQKEMGNQDHLTLTEAKKLLSTSNKQFDLERDQRRKKYGWTPK